MRRHSVARIKAVFFVPLTDNDERDLKAERIALETEMYVLFVGWTKLGVVEGAYRMADGVQTMDHHVAYMVIFDEDRVPELEDVLRRFKAKTTQESIYLELQYNFEVRFI